jgi:hypothetical protein
MAERPQDVGTMGPFVAALIGAVFLALATPQPSPAVLPPGVRYAGPSDPVAIESVVLSSDVVQGGDLATGRVLTTSNAAAMLARVGSYQVNVPRVDVGTFALTMRVPKMLLPSYRATIVLIAIRADGATAEQTVSVKIRH